MYVIRVNDADVQVTSPLLDGESPELVVYLLLSRKAGSAGPCVASANLELRSPECGTYQIKCAGSS